MQSNRLSVRELSLLLCAFLSFTEAVLQPNTLLPFGPQHGDNTVFSNDDHSSPQVCLNQEVPFFGKGQRCFIANNNGAIFFSTADTVETDPFPLQDHEIIAPFWGDVDTSAVSNGGSLFYRVSTNSDLLTMANEYVHTAFVEYRDFHATEVFLATWDRVGYFNKRTDLLNTFQCVLISDGRSLFTLFLYQDIQWTMGQSHNVPAQVGFNAGDGFSFFSLNISQTPQVVDIESTSNVGVAGVWVFLASTPSIIGGGCIPGEVHANPSYGSILGGEAIAVQGCFNGSNIVCEFDGVQRSATPISTIEVMCVAPQLRRVGRVTLRMMVDGVSQGETVFTILDVEQSHQVDLTPNTNTGALSFTSEDSLSLTWTPAAIFPQATPTSYRVNVVLYELDNSTNVWFERATLLSNTENDGSVEMTVTDVRVQSDVAPVAIQVVVNPSSIDSASNQILSSVSSVPIGKWTSQFYYIQYAIANDNSRHLCDQWFGSESNDFAQTLSELTITCPPRREQALLQNSGFEEVQLSSYFGNTAYHSQWLQYFHPGAESCFRQSIVDVSQNMVPQQECCYNSQGSLLTGLPGGGRAYKLSQGVSRSGHYLEDEWPYIVCCRGQFPSCQQLYERRPSDIGTGYNPPSVAWMMGDPHLITLDGHRYTFNGRGEYTLVQTSDQALTIQGRMTQFEAVPATVFTALALKEGQSDTVMLTADSNGIAVYVNGLPVATDAIREQRFEGVTITTRDTNSVGVLFDSGAFLEALNEGGFLSRIAVSLPVVYMGRAQGLLGVYNGNTADDLTARDGTVLVLSVSDEDLHSQFGQSWVITEASSLFTYLPYQSFGSFSNPQFTPMFNPDPSTASPVLAAICNADPFCLYDGLVTGDNSLASRTKDASSEAVRTEELSSQVTCSPSCVNGACVSENTCACSEGYQGSTCEEPVYTTCESNPCLDRQSCGVLGQSYYCESCTVGSDAPICQLQGTGPCSTNQCLNGGVCSPNSTLTLGFRCLCPPFFSGILCGIDSRPTIPCNPSPCQNGGTCTVTSDGSTYQCSCVNGFSGNDCSLMSTSLLIAIIAGVLCGMLALVIVVMITVVITCWVQRGKCSCRRKKSEDVHTIELRPRPESSLLTTHRTSITRSTTPGSDPPLNKPQRLGLTPEPEPSHNVLEISPTMDASSQSLSNPHRENLYHFRPESSNSLHVPNGRHSSVNTLPVIGRTSSNFQSGKSSSQSYIANGRSQGTQSQQMYYDYMGGSQGSQYYSMQSMDHSSQRALLGKDRAASRRSSVNTGSVPSNSIHINQRRASAAGDFSQLATAV